MAEENKEAECCPKFNPEPWDEKVLDWQDKKFIRDSVKTFMFMPINFGGVITKMMKKVEEAGAKTLDNLCLSDHASKWKMDIYLAVDRDVQGAENVTLSGKFLSKVYEGDFKDTGKWVEDFKKYAQGKKYKIKKHYMWYTTCPKCAKKYGHNYVVTVAEIE